MLLQAFQNFLVGQKCRVLYDSSDMLMWVQEALCCQGIPEIQQMESFYILTVIYGFECIPTRDIIHFFSEECFVNFMIHAYNGPQKLQWATTSETTRRS